VNIVTGAFSFTGKLITQRLLAMGENVRTLTGHPDRPNTFGNKVSAVPYNFDNPGGLVKELRGAKTLYNTYWVRFPYGDITYEKAVENTKILIAASKEAGLKRIVHISIANATEDSSFPYFKGKAQLERAIMGSGLSYTIIRPAVIFGEEGILINNIAWLLRRFPVFVIPGTGDYRLQPIFVEDLADIAVAAGHKADNIVMDAVGPETFTFDGLVRLITGIIQSKALIIHLNQQLAFLLTRVLSLLVNDVILTKDEVQGLTSNLLVSHGVPTGHTKLSAWLKQNPEAVGRGYLSELKRHYF